MLDERIQVGKMVYSKAGRDKGKAFVIVGILDENYVYISNGEIRPTDKPKKKKIKHLNFTNEIAEDIKSMILSGEKVNNSCIKKFLKSHDMNKEV